MPRPRPPRAVRVRRARTGDQAALLALERRCFTGDRLSARALAYHRASPRAWFGVAERGGVLLGAALVLFRRGARVARLYSIAVDPAARGAGVGARLLAAAEAAARRRGCAALGLEVRVDNRVAAALYAARGYARAGRRPAYYEDGADAWRYVKALSKPR